MKRKHGDLEWSKIYIWRLYEGSEELQMEHGGRMAAQKDQELNVKKVRRPKMAKN